MDTLIHYILTEAERSETYRNVNLTGITARLSRQQATLYALDCFNRLPEEEQDAIVLTWKESMGDQEAMVLME